MQELKQDISDAEIVSETKKVKEEPAPPLTDEQKAWLSFEHYSSMLIKKLLDYEGSRKQIARAWINSAISPLNKEELKFSYPAEKELFDIFTEANSAKFILMLYGLVKAGVVTLNKPLMELTTTPSEQAVEELAKTLASPVVEKIEPGMPLSPEEQSAVDTVLTESPEFFERQKEKFAERSEV